MNKKDFDKFYSKYNKPVYFYINKITRNNYHLSQDVLQETFLKAYVFLQTRTINQSYTKTWLCSIARNAYYDLYRREKYDRENYSLDHKLDETFTLLDCLTDDTNYDNIDTSIILDSVIPKTLDNMKKHSPTMYETFTTYIQLDNYKDTAKENNILLDTVKTRILRARRFVKKDIPEEIVALIQN